MSAKNPPAIEVMSMRDYFAAAASSAILGAIGAGESVDANRLARDAYRMADAMIKERAK